MDTFTVVYELTDYIYIYIYSSTIQHITKSSEHLYVKLNALKASKSYCIYILSQFCVDGTGDLSKYNIDCCLE